MKANVYKQDRQLKNPRQGVEKAAKVLPGQAESQVADRTGSYSVLGSGQNRQLKYSR
jgi:hypothetical protein